MLKKSVSLFLIANLFFGSYLPVSPVIAQEQTKTYRLAVVDLDPIGVSETESKALSDKLRSHISQLMREKAKLKFACDIIERAQIDRILDEHQLKTTGCVSDSCAVEFGKILQADRIAIGSVSLIGQTYSVIVRIVDVETSRTIDSSDKSFRGSIDALITRIIPQVGNDLFLVPAKKSRIKWYILAGAIVAGGIYAVIPQDTGKEPVWLPDPPAKPQAHHDSMQSAQRFHQKCNSESSIPHAILETKQIAEGIRSLHQASLDFDTLCTYFNLKLYNGHSSRVQTLTQLGRYFGIFTDNANINVGSLEAKMREAEKRLKQNSTENKQE